jgi:hypothetical protein
VKNDLLILRQLAARVLQFYRKSNASSFRERFREEVLAANLTTFEQD